MRKVSRPTGSPALGPAWAKLGDLCDATQEQTEEIADAYTLTLPTPFVPVRTLDVTKPLTANQVGAVLATLIRDMQNRGVNRKQGNA